MATKIASPAQQLFIWEGKDKSGKSVRGEMRAAGQQVVRSQLRRQNIAVTKIKKLRLSNTGRVTQKEITFFTRQLATMMSSGVPLLQSFEICIKGATNTRLARLLNDVRIDIETGSSLSDSLRKHPVYFDKLYCNLVEAGEQAGILDFLLDRLATYMEKILAIKSKIKTALIYPAAVIVISVAVVCVLMIFVIPEFKKVFAQFGSELPLPTEIVIAISDFFVSSWYIILFGIIIGVAFFIYTYKRSPKMQFTLDRMLLKVPIIGTVVRKATIARWTRTLGTMFAAGVPLVEALESVGGASGNRVYEVATEGIRNEVSIGSSLTVAMQQSEVFPVMAVQMVAIGEESGSLEAMLVKISEFLEREVDDAVEGLSTLLEPIIIVFLGIVIGGVVVAMYLPIFKIGAVV